MKIITALRCATMLALATPAAANAATIADTGTPTGGIEYTLAPFQQLAGQFSVGGATTITVVQGFFRGSGTVTATLYAPGPLPASANVLFSSSFAVTGPAAVSGGEAWYGASGLNWAVAPGDYWLGFSTSGNMSMRDGALAPLGGYAVTLDGNWIRKNNLDIGIRVFGNPAGAIPEPATWALLILGFGAVGAGMRARQRTQVKVRLAG